MSDVISFCIPLVIGGTVIADDIEGDARICSGFPSKWEIRVFSASGDKTKWASLDDPVDTLALGLRNQIVTHLLAHKRGAVEEAKMHYYRGTAYGQGASSRQLARIIHRSID